MNEPTKTDFQPRWYRNATPELRNALADFPANGSIPLEWPRYCDSGAASQPSEQKLDSLEGIVTALDIEQGELRLSVAGQKDRIKGTFHVMLHPTLLESLGKRITLFGKVSYKRNQIVSVLIQQAEVLDTE